MKSLFWCIREYRPLSTSDVGGKSIAGARIGLESSICSLELKFQQGIRALTRK